MSVGEALEVLGPLIDSHRIMAEAAAREIASGEPLAPPTFEELTQEPYPLTAEDARDVIDAWDAEAEAKSRQYRIDKYRALAILITIAKAYEEQRQKLVTEAKKRHPLAREERSGLRLVEEDE